MSPTSQKTFTFVLPDALKIRLRTIRARDGIAESEQIRRGIEMWLEAKGVQIGKAERKRAVTRRRP